MPRYAPLDDETVAALKRAVDEGQFPGVTFEQAMKLALTDGIVPESGLPVESILKLDDWLLGRSRTASPASPGT